MHSVVVSKKLRDKKTYDYFPISVLKQARPAVSVPEDDILLSFLPRRNFTRFSFLNIADEDEFKTISQKTDFRDAIVLI